MLLLPFKAGLRAKEIALARSAAPAEVSRDATVYVLTDTGYAVAVPGSNGNACLVDRSWPDSLEPQCFDPDEKPQRPDR